jgi:hypothetical protein
MSTTARVAYIRTAERHDALGEKVVFTGVLEDDQEKYHLSVIRLHIRLSEILYIIFTRHTSTNFQIDLYY